MQEVKKEGLVGKGMLPPPPLGSLEGKKMPIWILGTGALFRPIDSEQVYRVIEITHSEVVVAAEGDRKDTWPLEHDTPVYPLVLNN